jgi:hypothetical protein
VRAAEVARSNKKPHQEPESDNLFGWTVFILSLCGIAVACWIGTFYVFTHPEEPFDYQLLAKLHKLDPPKRFELTAAPAGEFLPPDKLLAKYGALTETQLNEESKQLLRSYLRNYDHHVGKVSYATGKFTILDSYPLGDSKFMDSGMVVIAQSVDIPTIFIEHLFPAGPDHLKPMQRTLTTGLGVELRRSFDLSALIHVENLGNSRLLFTCVPLLYGPYGTTESGSGFQLDPPKALNLKAGLPVVSQSQIRDAEQRYAQYRKAMGGSEVASANKNTKPAPNLIGSEPTPTPTPVAKATPLMPPPKSGGKISGKQLAANAAGSSAQPAALAPPQPPKAASPQQAPAATPAPSFAAVSTTTPRLQPFLTASPTPATTGGVGSWQIYRPSQMPRGRLVDVDQSVELADKGVGPDPIYLRGGFVVTATKDNRAVLRPQQSLTDRVLNRGNARVIAEFPRGVPTPQIGQNFQRGAERPFQIVDVRKGADGQVNIYVREITSE